MKLGYIMGRLELGGRIRLCTRARRDCKRRGNGEALIDYKFHMFKQPDGSFQYVLQWIQDRFSENGIQRTFFVNQLEKNYNPTTQGSHRSMDITLDNEEKLVLLQMIKLSQKLMKDLDYARVDWYYIDGKIYFGEITLTPAAGANITFLGETLNQQMGAMWHDNPSSH